jgi:hypothetical protein
MCGPWCCGWHARIRAGATGGSAVSWPDSASGYRPRRSVECSPAPDSTWPRGLRAGLARVPARAGREHRRVRLLVLRERAPAPVVRVVLHRACKPARLARRLHDPPMGRRVRARDRHGPAWCPRPPRQWSIRRRRSQPRHRARQRSRLSLGRATRVMGATSMRSSRAHAHARRVARRPPRARLRARVPASLTGSRIGRQRNARDKLAWGKRSADRSGRAPSLSSLEQRTLASARRSDGAARCSRGAWTSSEAIVGSGSPGRLSPMAPLPTGRCNGQEGEVIRVGFSWRSRGTVANDCCVPTVPDRIRVSCR